MDREREREICIESLYVAVWASVPPLKEPSGSPNTPAVLGRRIIRTDERAGGPTDERAGGPTDERAGARGEKCTFAMGRAKCF